MKISRFFLIVLMVAVLLVFTSSVGLAAGFFYQDSGDSAGSVAQILETVVTAAFMVTVAERLVAGLITPLWERFKWDKFYLMYVGWAMGGILVSFSQVNIFANYIPNPTIGLVLTAVVSGGGANLLHDLFDNPNK